MGFCECVGMFVFACVWLCVVCLCVCGYEFEFVFVYAFESIICGYVAVFLSIFYVFCLRRNYGILTIFHITPLDKIFFPSLLSESSAYGLLHSAFLKS